MQLENTSHYMVSGTQGNKCSELSDERLYHLHMVQMHLLQL